MKIWHIAPKDEMELHESSADCACKPFLVLPHRLEGTNLEGEVVWQHCHFNPLEAAWEETTADQTELVPEDAQTYGRTFIVLEPE